LTRGQKTSSTASSLLCGPGAFSKSPERLTRKPDMTPTLTTSSDSHGSEINGGDLTADQRKAILENVRETKL